ncbi:MAG: zf-HC2 domain-containing protein [Acidobacteriota bacterium]
MLCNDVKRVVYFFLDGSLAEPRKQDYSAHLQLCPDCEARTKIHQRLRIFILKRLRPDSAPQRLKQRLVRTFRAMSGGWA